MMVAALRFRNLLVVVLFLSIIKVQSIYLDYGFTQQFGKLMKSRQMFMVIDHYNANLMPPEKSLLKLYLCIGHLNIAWVKNMIIKNILSVVDYNVTEIT